MKIVLASHNKGKIQEVTDILAPFGIEVEPIPEDFPEIEEDGDSFEENAKIKARAVCKAIGLPAVGDDSGLVIDALDGFPGIHSARWAGPNVSAHEKNQLLIEKMLPIPEDERGAQFVCVAACVFPDGRELSVRGQCRGTILSEEHGTGGFGYDPIFYLDEFGCSSAALSREQKNAISHRGKALRAMKELLVKEI